MKTSCKNSFFLLYLWKFQTKQSSSPGNSTNCVRSLGISMTKNQDPWKLNIFFLDHPWKFNFFLIKPWKFHMLFFDTFWNSISSSLPPLNPAPSLFFSGIANYFINNTISYFRGNLSEGNGRMGKPWQAK